MTTQKKRIILFAALIGIIAVSILAIHINGNHSTNSDSHTDSVNRSSAAVSTSSESGSSCTSNLQEETLQRDAQKVLHLRYDLSDTSVSQDTLKQPLRDYMTDEAVNQLFSNSDPSLKPKVQASSVPSSAAPSENFKTASAQPSSVPSASKLYAQRSGLVQADVLKEQQQAKESRLQNFLRQLQTHGFHVQKAKEKEHRYEITDKNGKSVGFIGTDNRAVITSDDFHERRRLTNLYQQNNEPVASQPQQLSRWRQLLQNLGYSVRMFFSRTGTQVDIQDTQHHDVASIEDNQEIHFTEQAAAHDREQLSSAQEDIRKDLQAGMEQQANVSRQTNVSHEAEEQQIFKEQQAEQEQEHRQEQHQEFKEEGRENEASADGIFLTAAEVQALSTLLYENRGLLTHMDSSLLDKLSQPEVSKEEPGKTVSLPEQSQPVIAETHQLSRQEQAIQANFQKAYQLLQTMQGFESPQALSLQKAMIQDYGTISQKEFQKKLEHGEYAGQPTLEQQLHSAKREAQQVSNSRTRPQ